MLSNYKYLTLKENNLLDNFSDIISKLTNIKNTNKFEYQYSILVFFVYFIDKNQSRILIW